MQQELDQDLIKHMTYMLADYNTQFLNYDWSAFATLPDQSNEPTDDLSSTNEVKVYRARDHVKATHRQQQQSRNYYVRHREEILIKRRLYRERLIREGRYAKNHKYRSKIMNTIKT